MESHANAGLDLLPIGVVQAAGLTVDSGEDEASGEDGGGGWIRILGVRVGSVVLGLQLIPAGDHLIADRALGAGIPTPVFAIIAFLPGNLNIPTEAEIDRKPVRDLPIILHIHAIIGSRTEDAVIPGDAAAIGEAEQHAGDRTAIGRVDALRFGLLGPTGIEGEASVR